MTGSKMTNDGVLAYRLISFVYLGRTIHDPEPSTLLPPLVMEASRANPCRESMDGHFHRDLSERSLTTLRGWQRHVLLLDAGVDCSWGAVVVGNISLLRPPD